MKLTPLDIHHKEFRRSIRGYNEEDVDVFLDQVAEEFERLFKENGELKERVDGMKDKVKQYEGVEQTLQKALFTGQQAADQVKENAIKESELIVGDAEKKAKGIIQDIKKEKAQVVAELKRLQEAEDRFRADFKNILSTFMTEADEAKVGKFPSEIEEAIAAAPEPEETAAADAPAEPNEEPNVPAALDVDAAGAGNSQVPVVSADIEPPVMSDISQPVAPSEPVQPGPMASVESETDVMAPAETQAPGAGDEAKQAPDAIGSPTSADIAGNFFSTAESNKEVADEVADEVPEIPAPPQMDYFQQSPETPDIGAGELLTEEQSHEADEKVEQPADSQSTSEFKITLGAPVHETSASTPAPEPDDTGMPADVLVDLKNQEVPEFDPSAKNESSPKPAEGDDVVSSFFDDDLGDDD